MIKNTEALNNDFIKDLINIKIIETKIAKDNYKNKVAFAIVITNGLKFIVNIINENNEFKIIWPYCNNKKNELIRPLTLTLRRDWEAFIISKYKNYIINKNLDNINPDPEDVENNWEEY